MSAIQVCNLVAGHRGVPAVRGLDLEVRPGEVVALLGPNGAGKTTTLLTIAGVLPVLGGTVTVLGAPVEGHSPHRAAKRGLALVPDDRAVFHELSVAENLRLARRRRGSLTVDDVLDHFPALRPLVRRRCGLLSGGEQQMLALAKALLTAPKALMIDEMTLGLAPIVVERLAPIVRTIATEHAIAVLLVEQHVHVALELADRAYVLSHGELVLDGPAPELARRRDVVMASYIGEQAIASQTSESSQEDTCTTERS